MFLENALGVQRKCQHRFSLSVAEKGTVPLRFQFDTGISSRQPIEARKETSLPVELPERVERFARWIAKLRVYGRAFRRTIGSWHTTRGCTRISASRRWSAN